jgi:hypothetical protein
VAVGIRHAVNDESTVEPRHAWVERVPNAPQWLPHNYPFGIQDAIWRLLKVRVVFMPKKLDLSWYEGICLSTSGLDIVFQTTTDLITFMGHTHPEIPLYIAQGGYQRHQHGSLAVSSPWMRSWGLMPLTSSTYHAPSQPRGFLTTLQDLGL